MVKKRDAIRKSGKSKGTLKKGYRYGKGGRVVEAKKTKTTDVKRYLVGRSVTKRDNKRLAMPPGKRTTAHGTVYYESRANRADLDKKRRL